MSDSISFFIKDDSDITLVSGYKLKVSRILESVESVNKKFVSLGNTTAEIAFNVFDVIDFRMLSGLLGESLVSDMSHTIEELIGNPNIDGYPDLVDVSKPEYLENFKKWRETDSGRFIKYPYGGVEIKNTFGTKKSGVHLLPGDKRITKINKKLDWKAHHRYTNHLLAVYSDFVNGSPQIVAVMYSDQLNEEDWAEKQNPKAGSTMTSFSVIKASGWEKLCNGLKFCNDDPIYKEFFGVNV